MCLCSCACRYYVGRNEEIGRIGEGRNGSYAGKMQKRKVCAHVICEIRMCSQGGDSGGRRLPTSASVSRASVQ